MGMGPSADLEYNNVYKQRYPDRPNIITVDKTEPWDFITEKEPGVVVWNGRNINDIDDNNPKNRIMLKPNAMHNAYMGLAYPPPDNQYTSGLWINAADGLWVPPNQYVWVYNQNINDWNNRFYRADAVSGGKIIDKINTAMWNEAASRDKDMLLCPGGDDGDQVAELISATINRNGTADKANILDHPSVNRVLGQNSFRYGDMNDVFGDKFHGSAKTLEIAYKCGRNGVVFPSEPPNAVYPPGFHDFNAGNDDSRRANKKKYAQYIINLKDSNKPVVSGDDTLDNLIWANALDAIGIRRFKTWDEHLEDCCMGRIKDKDLCGKFGVLNKQGNGTNTEQAKYCKRIYDKCTIDDIKTVGGKPGKCAELCDSTEFRKNPAIVAQCDRIKKEFCDKAENKNSPWCGCINYADKYKSKIKMATDDGKSFNKMCLAYNDCSGGIGASKTAFALSSDEAEYLAFERDNCPSSEYWLSGGDSADKEDDADSGSGSTGSGSGSSGSGSGSTGSGAAGGAGSTGTPISSTTPNWFYYALVFIVLIFFTVIFIIFRKKKNKSDNTESENE